MTFVGTDIVKISRIENIITNHGKRFLKHIFTEYEQSLCNYKVSPYIHYSGKFAAKEAIKKAILTSNSRTMITLKSIEIRRNANGSPEVLIEDLGINNAIIQVSISHTNEYAVATAILELI